MHHLEGFWCPTAVDILHTFLRRGIPKQDRVLEYEQAFVRNIAYNLQYLEYLNYSLTETSLHATVRTLTQKSFVICGMSIIEALLWYVLKKSKQQRIDEWEELYNLGTRTFREKGAEYKINSKLFRKRVSPEDVEMQLDTLIKRVESKKLLGLETQVYKDLSYLRRLRNRVHIHAVQHDKDTDWWSFGNREVKLMKGVMNSVLTSNLFHPSEDDLLMLRYLTVEESTESLASDLPF